MAKYKCTASPAKVWKDGVGVGGQIDEVKHGAIVTAERQGDALYITIGTNKGKVGWSKLGWFELLPSQPPPSPPPPPPPSSAGRLWEVRGDEELKKFNYRSRTLAPDWAYLQQTPSVFRFDKIPTLEPTEHRVNVFAQDGELRRLNLYDGKKARVEYLYSKGTALFNRTGFPKLQYLTMSFNVLEEVAVEGGCLKFRTLKPTSNTAGMTHDSHPHFVHRFDIVTVDRNGNTAHVLTPHGNVYWFLTTVEGAGYIPLEWVKPKG